MAPRTAVLAALLTLSLATPVATSPADSGGRLRVDRRAFRTPNGSRFAWRGLTSFRLLEMVAHGRAAEAERVLQWAARRGITVVRVLAMADVLFRLSPSDGQAALPGLLERAAKRGLHVEIVALADTRRIPVDPADQVTAVGAICAAHDNCLLEIANEPWHATQERGLGAAERLRGLRSLVPPGVPVSFGSADADDSDAYARGDYLTVHLARESSPRGWGHVLRMRNAAALGARTGKPVVDDEPIGAAEKSEPGRRDSEPDRWFAKGLLARVFGLGATFHYEGGLQSRLPHGVQLTCFEAWRRGLDALPAGLEDRTTSSEAGTEGSAAASYDHAAAVAVYVAEGQSEAWAVAVGVLRDPMMKWRPGWKVVAARNYPGVSVMRAVRQD